MMKVKFLCIHEDHLEEDEDYLTLGKVYDCYRIFKSGSALIFDDYGEESLLRRGEYEIVEE